MALIGVAFSLGFLFGPMIGAAFSMWGKTQSGEWYMYPAIFALALSILDILYFVIFLKVMMTMITMLMRIMSHRSLSPPAIVTPAPQPPSPRHTATYTLHSCSGLPALLTWTPSNTRTCRWWGWPTSSISSSTLVWSSLSPSSPTSGLTSPPCNR